ncbi:glycoside hydrolase family 2 TIM barrel-domain containing protein [Mucilaginibacter sp. CSA2-8R]|uniref:glycoside hydrolase family 2 TIM barrel-domain containing protein n=1 Tax=Mucilaginibacter sp. CSA2-8R TaxID=3141542 RepID=UPI00315DA36C
MKPCFFNLCLYFFWCLLFAGCKPKQPAGTVYIKSEHGTYRFYRNGKPFFVKGASGFTNLKALSNAGGNTIRVWDTAHIDAILDSAQAYHMAVVVGLPMPDNKNMDDFYNDETKVAAHYKNLKTTVNRYKHHPALLSWCIGNELAFPYKPNYNRFYTAFNQVVDMIHHDDPNHPVTTTIINFQRKNIACIKFRTAIDFISLNIFGDIKHLKHNLKDFEWLWKGPFLVTEWGIDGPWYTNNQTAWGSFIENSTFKKAEQYQAIYQNQMPLSNPRFLGSLVFYWGQKQEYTPTWFGLFDKAGRSSQTVNTMNYLWTGKKTAAKAPPLKCILLNFLGSQDNILLAGNTTAQGQVYLYGTDTANITYQWQLFPENYHQVNDIYSQKEVAPILHSFVTASTGKQVTFRAPKKEGPYRLYVYAYNKQNYFAACNIPFYVLNNPQTSTQ